MSREMDLIEAYFDAFNRHDLDRVLACFDDDAVIVGADGKSYEGLGTIRGYYTAQFEKFPDGKCAIRTLLGTDGVGAVESTFTGTKASEGRPVRAVAVEIVEFRGEKIKELRDYHRLA